MHYLLPALLLASSPAWGHSFYDTDCCGGNDCAPATAGEVIWTPAGWRVETPSVQEVVPFSDVHRLRYTPPPARQFHVCEFPAHHIRCLYTPEPDG